MTDGPDSSRPGSHEPSTPSARPAPPASTSTVLAEGVERATPGMPETGGGDVDPTAVTRKLLMGVALLLALVSVYSGVFNWPKAFQMMMAAGATIALVSALRKSSGEPPRRR